MSKQINFKQYANIDPTYKVTDLDIYANRVYYNIIIGIYEIANSIQKEKINFNYYRERSFYLVAKRSFYYLKYYSKQNIIDKKLYKQLRTYRIIIKQFFLHIANIYLNYPYWCLVYYLRCFRFIWYFLNSNASLIFIELPRAFSIKHFTIKDTKILYSFLYLQCVMILTCSLASENKRLRSVTDEQLVENILRRRRQRLTNRHQDCLPYALRSQTNYKLLVKKRPQILRKSSGLFRKQKYLTFSEKLSYLKKSEILRKNLFSKSLRYLTFSKDIKKRLVGYEFPDLPIVSYRSLCNNLETVQTLPTKQFRINYTNDDFYKDLKNVDFAYKPEILYKGLFKQTQNFSDMILGLKDHLLLITQESTKNNWFGVADANYYAKSYKVMVHFDLLSDITLIKSKAGQEVPSFSGNATKIVKLSQFFDNLYKIPRILQYIRLPSLNLDAPVNKRQTDVRYTMQLDDNQPFLYEGPVLSLDRKRDVILKNNVRFNFQNNTKANVISNIDSFISPDRDRRKSLLIGISPRRLTGKVQFRNVYSILQRGLVRKKLSDSLDPKKNKQERMLLNEYKASKHQRDDANAFFMRRHFNHGERMTTTNMAYLAFPEYHSKLEREAIFDNILRSFVSYYKHNLHHFDDKSVIEGPKKLETEIFTDKLLKVVRDSNNNVINLDTVNAHCKAGGNLKFSFRRYGSSPYKEIVVNLQSVESGPTSSVMLGGLNSFVDINKAGNLSFPIKNSIILNIVDYIYGFIDWVKEVFIWIITMDIFGLLTEFFEMIQLKETDDLFIIISVSKLLYIILIIHNFVILYLFYRLHCRVVRFLAIHTLNHIMNIEQEEGGLPIYSKLRHFIADWYNLSYFLPYTIYKNFDVDFTDVAGIQHYVDKLHELYETVGYRQTLYRLPGFIETSIDFERDLLREKALVGEQTQAHLILSGAPGTGKTFLVQAIGGELKIPVLLFTPNQFIGGLEDKIKRIFDKAEELAPCIIFIDEIDAIGYARPKIDLGQDKVSLYKRPNKYKPFSEFMREQEGFANEGNLIPRNGSLTGFIGNSIYWRDSVNEVGLTPTQDLYLNTERYIGEDLEATRFYYKGFEYDRSMLYRLLIECDSLNGRSLSKLKSNVPSWNFINLYRKKKGVGIIGATNRYHVLDPALLRVGRFHTRLHFTIPEEKDRFNLFHMKKGEGLNYDSNFDWEYFLRTTSGWTPAEITGVVGHSNMIAYERNISVITNDMVNNSINYILGVNFKVEECYSSKEAEEHFLFKQASRLFFDCVFKTGTNRDVYSKYPRRDRINLVSLRKKIITYYTINHKGRSFYERKLLGLLGLKIGEMYHQLHTQKDKKNNENPLVINIHDDISIEYAIIFIYLMVDYWCLYTSDSLLTSEAILPLNQYNRYTFDKKESILDALAAKIVSNRTDHPEYPALCDLLYFMHKQMPNTLMYLKHKIDWHYTYSLQFGLGKYTEGINPFFVAPTEIFGFNVHFRFSPTILLDFHSLERNKMERKIYALLYSTLRRGCIIAHDNLAVINFLKEKLREVEFLRVIDAERMLKEKGFKIIV